MNAKDGDEVITTVPIIEEELYVGRTEVTTGRSGCALPCMKTNG